MALIGNIEPLKVDSDINEYFERMDAFFECNVVEEDKKVPLFITLIGAEAYKLLKDLCTPEQPAKKKYADLQKILKDHLSPTKIVVAETFKFYQINQGVLTVAEYIVKLRNAAATCEFGTFLERALRDKFVCGLSNDSIQRKLLSEKDLTFEKACQSALSMEAVSEKTKELNSATSACVINAVKPKYKSQSQKRCGRCDRTHKPGVCGAKEWKCYSCGRKGHISKCCRNKSKVQGIADDPEEIVSSQSEDQSEEEDEMFVGKIVNVNQISKPEFLNVSVNEKVIKMEIDSGASVTVISRDVYKQNLSNVKLVKSMSKLEHAGGQKLELLGKLLVNVKGKNNIVKKMSLFVINAKVKTALLGRDWLDFISPKWRESIKKVALVKKTNSIDKNVLKSYPNVFAIDRSQKIQGFQVPIRIKENSLPVFQRPYNIPYALREAVEKELAAMEEAGIIEKTSYSDWATPVVTVPKKNGELRLCADFKSTLNPVLYVDKYPLPLIEDVIMKVSKGAYFSILDLSQAYLQCEVTADSQKYLTINTHKGLYTYKRLPFGIASAPALFQSLMDKILLDLEGCACYLDDIIVSGTTYEESQRNLNRVLERLDKYNVKANLKKCEFHKPSVTFLGYVLSGKGLLPVEDKVKAISEAPTPTNLTQLRSFLGMLNYYRKFIPMASDVLVPLYSLEKKGADFSWTEECEEAFKQSKRLLLESRMLVHYNPRYPITITTDASPYACGAVLSHIIGGVEHPVMFASSTFNATERNYAQIQREALAIVCAVKKFHNYIYGRKFTLITDHQPLKMIFGEKTKIPPVAVARLQRWAVYLSAYNYEIKYKKASEICHADALSRLPLNEDSGVETVKSLVTAISEPDGQPIDVYDVIKYTNQDPILQRVLEYTKRGWPSKVDDVLKPYYTRRNEITIENDCLVWGSRVIMPAKLRKLVTELLHEEHIGMVRMKMLARGLYWWPRMDTDIEEFVQSCRQCETIAPRQPDCKFTKWPVPNKAWQRIHVDHFYKFGKLFLIVVDALSRWIEVKIVSSTNAEHTIYPLLSIFSVFGIPEEIVSDNGPPFNGEKFKRFCNANNIKHTLTPPLHPRSNGAVERQVSTIKTSIAKSCDGSQDSITGLQLKIDNILLKHRVTPNSVTGKSPSEYLLKQIPRTKLDFVKPRERKDKVKTDMVRGERREFVEGEEVTILNKRNNNKVWIPGKISKRVSPFTYLVNVNGEIRYVHTEDIKTRKVVIPEEPKFRPVVIPIQPSVEDKHVEQLEPTTSKEVEVPIPPETTLTPPPQFRRSTRTKKPIDRLNL